MEIFSGLGIPKQIIADNVPFNSYECNDFAKRWDIETTTSSPIYPKSNGQSERAVQIAKNILKKSNDYEQTLVGLLEYRNTPTKDMNLSPAQLISNRRFRTKLPISKKLLQPTINENVHESLIKKSLKNKKYYDKHSKVRKDFTPGEKVFVQNHRNKTWTPATVVKKHPTPRSYIVENEEGKTYRRNSSFLKADKRTVSDLKPIDSGSDVTYSPSRTRSGKIFNK